MLAEEDAHRTLPYTQPRVDWVLGAHLGMIGAVRFPLLQLMHLNLQPQQEELGTGVVRDIGWMSRC
jgi:hypothetical protein